MGHNCLYSCFLQLFQQLTGNMLPMTRFEPRISGIGSNRNADRATTTALDFLLLVIFSFIDS